MVHRTLLAYAWQQKNSVPIRDEVFRGSTLLKGFSTFLLNAYNGCTPYPAIWLNTLNATLILSPDRLPNALHNPSSRVCLQPLTNPLCQIPERYSFRSSSFKLFAYSSIYYAKLINLSTAKQKLSHYTISFKRIRFKGCSLEILSLNSAENFSCSSSSTFSRLL